jgi:hypothetical protein
MAFWLRPASGDTLAGLDFSFGIRAVVLPLMMRLPCEGVTPPVPQIFQRTLTAAIRNYLEQRKSAQLGAATVSEIYTVLRDGGYKFGSKNEDNAKIVLASALRKSSSIFHRLPNGQYGLLAWYPTAKVKPDNGQEPKRGDKDSSEKKSEKPEEARNAVTNGEIREVILEQTGQFSSSDIETAVKAKYPSKELPKFKIPTVIFLLNKKGLLNVISKKAGSRPAVYSKA